MGTLAVRGGKGIVVARLEAVCTPRQQQLQQLQQVEKKEDVGKIRKRGETRKHISRDAAGSPSRVHPTGRVVRCGNVARNLAAWILLLENWQWQKTGVGL